MTNRPDPDRYDDDADIDEAPRETFEARAFGLADPPTVPTPAVATGPDFDELVRGTGVMDFANDRRPYTPRHARGRR